MAEETADETIAEFLDGLASSAPTPGGGGAAAISGAMGAALVSDGLQPDHRQEEIRRGRGGAEGHARAVRDVAGRAHRQIADDVEAFDAVMGAYGLPKGTDEEKAARAAKIQAALKVATDVPLDCCRACREVIDLAAGRRRQGQPQRHLGCRRSRALGLCRPAQRRAQRLRQRQGPGRPRLRRRAP